MTASNRPKQTDTFLKSEGDAWFSRNATVLKEDRDDIVLRVLSHLKAKPKRVLEIGAANGYRLAAIERLHGSACAGVEPSAKAVEEGKAAYPSIDLKVGAADSLPFEDNAFDMVIIGFCMYLVDPELHFRAVAEADRVLAEGGLLVIFDFQTPAPYYNDYAHLPGLRAHKMDFSSLFTAHPSYSLVHRELNQAGGDTYMDLDRREGVDVLTKNMGRAFPPNPYKS